MPVLQPKVNHNGPWECDTCCEDYDTATEQPWKTEDGDFVCIPECVKGQFERALESDYNWPARFGGAELLIADFESVLSPELVSAVKLKVAEMAAVDKASLLEPFKDQTRGEDYQICPECENPLTLGSGCNHMTCHFCHANFCFLCGEEVEDPAESDHWTVSRRKCPRYGPVGSNMYDDSEVPDWADDMYDAGGYADPRNYIVLTAEEEAREREYQARFGALHVDTWVWTVAMQSLRDDRIRQDQLRQVLARTEEDGRPTFGELQDLFRQYRPEHGVPEEEWAELFRGAMVELDNLFERGPYTPEYDEESDFLDHGMLTQPVGGMFNMMVPAQRIEAFMWMYNTTRDWETLEVSQRSAVFDMGPGGDDEMREQIADSMDHMQSQGWFEIYRFTPMQDAGVLVTVGPPREITNGDGTVWTPTEAWWRVVLVRQLWFFMVHLDRDMAQDRDNPQWVALVRESGGDWDEQRPQAWAQRFFPREAGDDDPDW